MNNWTKERKNKSWCISDSFFFIAYTYVECASVCVCVCVCVCVELLKSAHAQRHSCTGEIRLNKSEIPVSFKTLHLFPLLIIVITAVASRWGGRGERRRGRGRRNNRCEVEGHRERWRWKDGKRSAEKRPYSHDSWLPLTSRSWWEAQMPLVCLTVMCQDVSHINWGNPKNLYNFTTFWFINNFEDDG